VASQGLPGAKFFIRATVALFRVLITFRQGVTLAIRVAATVARVATGDPAVVAAVDSGAV